ncbi:2-phospho-L-lactate transferase [Pseudorhodoferax sp.]|uniref:2-phospho-L-lactate transferase n=1 Tax=Pseudorhodoferax sp. TaxID=1993553 RepID=UPI002DD6AAFF|nr:2-phospho-L-lactate transferase [Pseudorhodoferax sp.]
MRNVRAPCVVLLAGGVGGARMAEGLRRALPAASLTVVVNVGDDDWFHGLRVCPDLDTVLYTLSGRVNKAQAWGVEGDGTRALQVLKQLGAQDTWMTLGDADLGLHLHRTQRLRAGVRLTQVTEEVAQAFGVAVRVLPASDEPVATTIETVQGTLRFQEWFVARRCAPQVTRIGLDGAHAAHTTVQVEQALALADLVVFAPSNPLLSILPMLMVQGMAAALGASRAAKVVVSPLINGQAVKGPLHTLMRDLRYAPGNAGIADFYKGLVEGIAIDASDEVDRAALEAAGLRTLTASTRIGTGELAEAFARRLLAWSIGWAGAPRGQEQSV